MDIAGGICFMLARASLYVVGVLQRSYRMHLHKALTCPTASTHLQTRWFCCQNLGICKIDGCPPGGWFGFVLDQSYRYRSWLLIGHSLGLNFKSLMRNYAEKELVVSSWPGIRFDFSFMWWFSMFGKTINAVAIIWIYSQFWRLWRLKDFAFFMLLMCLNSCRSYVKLLKTSSKRHTCVFLVFSLIIKACVPGFPFTGLWIKLFNRSTNFWIQEISSLS